MTFEPVCPSCGNSVDWSLVRASAKRKSRNALITFGVAMAAVLGSAFIWGGGAGILVFAAALLICALTLMPINNAKN